VDRAGGQAACSSRAGAAPARPLIGITLYDIVTTVSEHPLDDDAASAFASASRRCLALLGLAEDDDPKKIVYAIDAIADAWQQGSRPPPDVLAANDAPYVIGSAWGDQLVRAFGWEWAVVCDRSGEWPSVCSAERSVVISPFTWLMHWFDDPESDITIALAFNMIAGNTIGSHQPGEYFDVMSGVRRVVPRR
jgi:hypothetical protein